MCFFYFRERRAKKKRLGLSTNRIGAFGPLDKTMSTQSKNGRAAQKSVGKTQDAIALLTQDHETVRGLLTQLEETTDRGAKKRAELLAKVALEIRVHARIEEEIFYPAYKEAAKSKEDVKLYFEAAEEHGLVDIVLPALEATEPTDETFGAKSKVLKDLIEHHAEEEETEMFPKAKRLLGKETLTELGAQLAARKEELQAELGARKGSSTPARSGAVNRSLSEDQRGEGAGRSAPARGTSNRSARDEQRGENVGQRNGPKSTGSRGRAKVMAGAQDSDEDEE